MTLPTLTPSTKNSTKANNSEYFWKLTGLPNTSNSFKAFWLISLHSDSTTKITRVDALIWQVRKWAPRN